MVKIIVIFATLLLLSACEQQKQASAEVSTIPKTIIDKATNDISAAEALAVENQKVLESIEMPANVEK